MPKWRFFILYYEKCHFGIFFSFFYEEKRRNGDFHNRLWRKCRFGIFLRFFYDEKRRNGDFHIILWRKCRFGVFLPLVEKWSILHISYTYPTHIGYLECRKSYIYPTHILHISYTYWVLIYILHISYTYQVPDMCRICVEYV